MSRTLQDVVDRVRAIYGDRSGVQILDPDIARWATDAQLDLYKKTETIQTPVVLVSVAGQSAYPTNFLYVREVFYDSFLLTKRTTNEIDAIDPYRLGSGNSGVPQYYWLTRDTINFYPTPSLSGKAINVTLIPRPSDLVNLTDVLSIPDESFESIVRYSLQMAKELDEDWGAAQYFKSDYKERAAESAYEAATLGDATYPVVRDTPGENW